MSVHCYTMTTGITTTPGFARKDLATHAVNCGTKCEHDCLYCSRRATLRRHRSFKRLGRKPYETGYAIIDPSTPGRVAHDAGHMNKRGLVQLCTLTDAWGPEARAHQIGRRCLEAILAQPGWSVRILTKSASVREDFDLIEQHRDRVQVGLSLTATPDRQDILDVLEPNASPVAERMEALIEAAARGLRTYSMLCPLLPGIADSPEQVERLIRFARDCRAEKIFAEPVNPRGRGLQLCQEALELWGYAREARAVARIRKWAGWSRYAADLLQTVQRGVRRHLGIEKLRFLLYPSRLMPEDLARIRRADAGVIWLDEPGSSGAGKRPRRRSRK